MKKTNLISIAFVVSLTTIYHLVVGDFTPWITSGLFLLTVAGATLGSYLFNFGSYLIQIPTQRKVKKRRQEILELESYIYEIKIGDVLYSNEHQGWFQVQYLPTLINLPNLIHFKSDKIILSDSFFCFYTIQVGEIPFECSVSTLGPLVTAQQQTLIPANQIGKTFLTPIQYRDTQLDKLLS